ncbi:MAG: transposase [Deltaproteobacteria bacterium]|nr:transposase [Deltaproteobacteria bacterium]
MNISRLNLSGYPSFITTKTMNNYPFFSNNANAECLVSGLLFGRRNNWLDLVAFVIMPDHLHLIIIPKEKNVSQCLHSIKSFSSKEINKNSQHKGSVWQSSFRDLTLWSEEVVIEKINYIHNNPVRKEMVSDPGNYRYSSANTRYEKELFRSF